MSLFNNHNFHEAIRLLSESGFDWEDEWLKIKHPEKWLAKERSKKIKKLLDEPGEI